MHMTTEGDDLAGERYMVNDDDEDYQHPQLETSRHLFWDFLFQLSALCRGMQF